MTWTKKQKLPALHQSGKVKNPDMPEVEQQNYTSTVLKYANLALPFPQLETNAKRVVPAINELYDNRVIANPPIPGGEYEITAEDGTIILSEDDYIIVADGNSGYADPLNTIKIDGVVYRIVGGGGASALRDLTDVTITSPTDGQALIYDADINKWVNRDGGGGDYTAGYGVYFSGDNNSVINADAGRKSRARNVLTFQTGYHWDESSSSDWQDTGTTVDDRVVYQSNAGTYHQSSGSSIGTYTISGATKFTVHVKQNSVDSSSSYIVLGRPNVPINISTGDYIKSYRGESIPDYVEYKYTGLNPYGETSTIQVMFHKEEPYPVGVTVNLNEGQWRDTGTEISGNKVYESDLGSWHIADGSSVCTLYINGVTSIDINVSQSSEYNYDYVYLGNLDERVTEDNYRDTTRGLDSGYRTFTYTCSPDQHFIQLMYAKDGSADSDEDRGYFYYVVNSMNNSDTSNNSTSDNENSSREDRAWIYAESSDPYIGEHGEVFNDYDNNYAVGSYAHAEGVRNLARSYASHAEGGYTIADGEYAHAEGYGNQALGYTSHAEGSGTTASSSDAHSEGHQTQAMAQAAHAEGWMSQATDQAAHAEGNNTIASGENSHTEGRETRATNIRAHAEGGYTLASGAGSHAEGYQTQATAESAHAEGYQTQTTASYAHSEGYSTEASGSDSHAEGNNTVASAKHAHAEGHYSVASGEGSHAEGEGASAVGILSHAEGSHTKAEGNITHVEGTAVAINDAMRTARYFAGESSGFCGHIEGSLCGIGPNAAYSHVEGLALNRYMAYDSSSSGYYHNDIVYLISNYGTIDIYTYYRCTIAEGYYIYGWVDPINYPQYWEIYDSEDLSAYYKVIHTDSDGNDYYGSSSTGIAGHAEGLATLVTGDYGHSEGNQTKATGTFAHAEGYLSTSSGNGSHSEGHETLAQGYSSHAEGGGSKAFGVEAHAEGGGSHAYGNWSHAEGAGNYAYASYSHVEGAGTFGVNVFTHTEGAGNANFASYGHVEGSGNKSFSSAHNSHTEGGGNVNGSVQGHIEGSGNQISGEESHLEGAGNRLHGPKTHGEGGGNAVYGIGSHVEGKHNEIAGFAVHAEGTQNLVGTSTSITHFNYGTSYAVGDIVGPNANYVNFDEFTSAYLYRCITAPGQIYPMPGNGVEYISPSTWNSSTSYTAGSVVCYPMPNYSGFGYYYCSSDVPAKDTPPPVDGSGWTSITSVLSPFKTTTTYSSSYYLLSTEQEANSGMPVAKVAANITINAMWEAIPTPHSTHIEGYKNIALGDYQHIQGKYNAVDANKAFIIGNGTADNARSNALTVDWSGNTAITGDLTTGVTLNTTAQTIGAAINEISVRVPAPPSTDGTYTLSLTITDGVPTYSWVSS